MHGNGKAFREVAKLCDGPPARAHVVLGVNFQPADRAGIGEDRAIMLGFVADAGTGGQGGSLGHSYLPD